MFRRCVLAAAIAFVPGFVAEAQAQERVDLPVMDLTSVMLNNAAMPAVKLSDLEQFPKPVQPVAVRSLSSPLLRSLYVTTAVVQALEEKRASVTGYNNRGAVTKSRRQPPACPVAVQQRA